jgi:hypothetical protein
MPDLGEDAPCLHPKMITILRDVFSAVWSRSLQYASILVRLIPERSFISV